MTHALLALALAVADPLGFPAPPAVALAAPPAPSGAVAARPTPPPAPPAAAELHLPTTAPALDALILPVAGLLGLALLALLATRRRRRTSQLVRVLETTSIGPKRALVVAQVGDEVMVIGSSEAGLQLLAARPAGLEARPVEGPARLVAVPDPAEAPPTAASPLHGLLARLRGRAPAAPVAPARAAPAFDALLAESAEDQELRRKLAHGQPGSVR